MIFKISIDENYDYIGQISNKLKDVFGMDKEKIKRDDLHTHIYICNVFCKGELKKELREIKVSKGQGPEIPDIQNISERPKKSYYNWEGSLIMRK